MTNSGKFFEPNTEVERIEYAIDALTLSVQFALQKAMHDNCITQKDLADRLGVSPARVSQMLSNSGPNLTLKTLGRIAYALGEEFELITLRELNSMKSTKKKQPEKLECEIDRKVVSLRGVQWVDETANSNRFPFEDVAA